MEVIFNVIEFLVVTVFFKYILLRWVAEKLAKYFQQFFVRTERETAIWLHYRNRALGIGHQHKTPIRCSEGLCRIV
jgi:hypothetical protein